MADRQLWHRMQQGEFVISVQVDPPYVDDTKSVLTALGEFRDTLEVLRCRGVKFIDINSSRGKKKRIFITSTQLADYASREFGFEVIPHVTARDASLAGLLSEVETVFALGGVTNFLVVTGDEHDVDEDFPHRGVYEVDSIGALNVLHKHLKPREAFSLAAAVNQNEPKTESQRIQVKEMAGSDFFMSQPVFSRRQADLLFDFYGSRTMKPLMIGVWPLTHSVTIKSIKDGNVRGVVLDEETWAESRSYIGNPTSLEGWGLDKTWELMDYIRGSGEAAGVYIVAPSRNPLLIVDLIPIKPL